MEFLKELFLDPEIRNLLVNIVFFSLHLVLLLLRTSAHAIQKKAGIDCDISKCSTNYYMVYNNEVFRLDELELINSSDLTKLQYNQYLQRKKRGN